MHRDYRVVWVINLDSSRSRSRGRCVPLSLAARDPSIEELTRAAASLGLDFEAHPEKPHPSAWFEGPRGCLFVRSNMSKPQLLRLLAKEIRRLRSMNTPSG